MYYPAQETQPEIEPVVQQFTVSSHDAIEQRCLGRISSVQDSLVENEAEYKHQFVRHLQNSTKSHSISVNNRKLQNTVFLTIKKP